MANGSFPGLTNVETSLRQIIGAINGLAADVVTVGDNVTDVATSITAAFPPPLTSSITWDPANLLTLTQDTKVIAVTGAVLGNAVLASFSLSLQGMTLTAFVSAADTVTAVLFNSTAGTLNLASGTLKVRVYA